MLFDIRLKIVRLLLKLINFIQPKYWKCNNCSHLELKEQEIMCWNCGLGEMIYKGK